MPQTLLTAPENMARYLRSGAADSLVARLNHQGNDDAFVSCDPPGRQLGSGGGTVNILFEAWQAAGGGSLGDWLAADQRLVINAGGESRRLPAYAGIGKAFIPLPMVPGLYAQRFDQMLCDFQLPAYTQLLVEAGSKARVMLTSGDVWLQFNPLAMPRAACDIVGVGMRVSPELAQHFGVFFVARADRERANRERKIAFFLQKPSPDEICGHLADHDFFVDTGMWLLSTAAATAMFECCGWDAAQHAFDTPDHGPGYLDFYGHVAPALGAQRPSDAPAPDAPLADLTASVIPLEDARFLHLGSSRQLFDVMAQIRPPTVAGQDVFSIASTTSAEPTDGPVWRESCLAEPGPRLTQYNLLTGLPAAACLDSIPEQIGLSLVPVGDDAYCFRPYHIDDSMRGNAADDATICGQDAGAWLARRGVTDTTTDVFDLPLFPMVAANEITQALLAWFLTEEPAAAETADWTSRERLSARDINGRINLARVFEQRREGHRLALAANLASSGPHDDGHRFSQDCAALGEFIETASPETGAALEADRERIRASIFEPVHQARFASLLARVRGGDNADERWDEAFKTLSDAIVHGSEVQRICPRRQLKEDQIVWARSPVRLDLAGGWTDTPPYCYEFGGAVVNVAVMLNGQPPIQAIVRPLAEPLLRIRSIDLGTEHTVRSYEELTEFGVSDTSFGLPRAALALSGFHPDFFPGTAFPSLERQLTDFGGGLELSLLCAVPKGSGLGTSSILAVTILGALNRACGLEWDEIDLYHRVLAIEQLMTTGGGWQDQAGAVFRGLKLVQTQAGPSQDPTVRYLPGHLFPPEDSEPRMLLYYTGITRMAKGILQEIVRDMLLGRRQTMNILDMIGRNAHQLYNAILTGDRDALFRGIARSWQLNKQIDPDTTNADIEAIIDLAGSDLDACKLLGAGGGGYFLMCGRGVDGAARLRERLEAQPPNDRARFVDFEIAQTGLQVTVS